MDRIRQEMIEDPNLLYNQRSDSPNHAFDKQKGARRKQHPRCCEPGCFEIRVPPSSYCDTHEEEGRIYD